jgi:hypothetical protein
MIMLAVQNIVNYALSKPFYSKYSKAIKLILQYLLHCQVAIPAFNPCEMAVRICMLFSSIYCRLYQIDMYHGL